MKNFTANCNGNSSETISGAGSANSFKGEICDLPAKELSAPNLPLELLPTSLKPWLQDVSERMGVPIEMVAIPAITALSLAVGRRAAVQPKSEDSGWIEIPNLWGAVVGRSGILKSPAMEEGLKPLKIIEQDLKDQFNASHSSLEAEKIALESQVQVLKEEIKGSFKNKSEARSPELLKSELAELLEKQKKEQFSCPRIIVNDSTVAKLNEIHRDNPLGLLVKRDELTGFLLSLSQEGRESDRAFFLESWSGKGSYTQDRVGRGTTTVEGLCLSIFGTIQPEPLTTYFSSVIEGKSGEDGLLARFQLMVYPNIPKWTTVDRKPDLVAFEKALQLFRSVSNSDFKSKALETRDGVPIFRFSSQAQSIFNEWRKNLENRFHSDQDLLDSPALASHVSKFRKLVPALSLIFFLIKLVSGELEVPEIDENSCFLATQWCEFLEKHALKIYAGTIRPGVAAAWELKRRIELGQLRSGMSVRDLYRKGWKGLGTSKTVAGLAVLEECGWVAIEEVQQERGAPKEIIWLHSSLGQSKSA